ncbi:HAD family phosphatase [Herbaspirillum sp. ST 5-3]|uniref:HAD family hydrolase n=1 Tax=Oxalobacteraceae TaxID=75682 RepID=UPI0010A4F68D|nr:HAD family phosphatase [Herbaspirillum sp. ST 5-3]
MGKPAQDFAACIFDCDGVVLDSEPLHAEAKRRTLEHFGVPHSASIFFDFKGRTDQDFFAYAAQTLAQGRVSADAMDDFKREQYRQLFAQVRLIEGVEAFIAGLRAVVPRIGLATSATRWDLELATQRYGLLDWFDAIVSREDTQRHKPDPEPYQCALSLLGAAPQQALVIEDAPNGIRSAKAAGCFVAGLTTTFAAEALRAAGADLVAADYAALRAALCLPARPLGPAES